MALEDISGDKRKGYDTLSSLNETLDAIVIPSFIHSSTSLKRKMNV